MSQQDARTVHDTAQRAADLLAALAEAGADASSQPERVIAVLRAHGEPDPIEISGADMTGLRRAARKLREIFAAREVTEAAALINALLEQHAHPPRLTTHGGQAGWHVHVDSRDDAPWDEWFLTSSCLALAMLLTERQALPAGICASPSCGRPFVNVGRGSRRRYCSAACGTRERVAAHRRSRG